LWIWATLIRSQTVSQTCQSNPKKKHAAVQAERTRVGVLEVNLALVERPADDRRQVCVEIPGAGQQVVVSLAGKVRIRADSRLFATRGALQPSIVLAVRSGVDFADGDELVAVQRSSNFSSVRQSGSTQFFADRRVQALQETHGRVLQDNIFGGGDGYLGCLDDVAVDAVDAQVGVRSDVAVTVVLAGFVDLVVAQVR
jgi:hypothetical protein